MTMLDSGSKYPLFTLRKHTAPITSLSFLHVPIATRTTLIPPRHGSGSKLTLQPFLVSVDESGTVIIWNLSTHRPVIEFQAHNSQIMTVKQLGIDQDKNVDHNYFGFMITHGRDHCIKFWKVFDEKGVFDVQEVYELPVNALNFSNVDFMGRYLITPNTMNSNAFDIYDIEFISKGSDIDENRLKRVFEAVDVFQTATKDEKMEFSEFKVERSDDDINRLDKFGIIMKILWVSESLIFLGFESGHVVSLFIDVVSKSWKIQSISADHFPDPVLSLWKDSDNQLVLSTSVRSEISIHDIKTCKTVLTKLENFGKVSSVVSLSDKYVLSSWNGYIKFYKFISDTQELIYESSFKKPKGLIQADLNVIGNIQGSDNELKDNRIVKPNALAIAKPSVIDPDVAKSLNRRDLKVLSETFLAIGYGDGTVMMYNEV